MSAGIQITAMQCQGVPRAPGDHSAALKQWLLSGGQGAVQTYSTMAGLVSGPEVGHVRQPGPRSEPTLPLPRSLVLSSRGP
jgi:hypothetical protein